MSANWKTLFNKEILKRGKSYFLQGRAKRPEEGADGYSVNVSGSRDYQVHLYTKWEKGMEYLEDMSCTCPYAASGYRCKHMAAALFRIESDFYPLFVQGRADAGEAARRSAGYGRTESGSNGSRTAAGSGGRGQSTAEKKDRSAGKETVTSELPRGNELTKGIAGLLEEERRQMEAALADEPGQSAEDGNSTDDGNNKDGRTSTDDGNGTNGDNGTNGGNGTDGGSAAGETAGRTAAALPVTASMRPAMHMEPYHYFNWDHLRKSVEIDTATMERAKKIAASADFRKMNVKFGYLKRNSWETEETDEMVGMVSVRVEQGCSKVKLTFDADNIREEECTVWECRRSFYQRRTGNRIRLCEHSAALLLRLRDYLEKENPGDATSLSGMRMLDRSNQGEISLADSEDLDLPAVRIQPVIDVPAPTAAAAKTCIPKVSFRVGATRMFKVKKISAFVDAVKAGEEMLFGSKTKIRLREDLLTEESVIWYRIMQDALREERQRKAVFETLMPGGYMPGYGYIQISDAIPLYGESLDSFYKAAEGMRLEFCLRENKESYVRGRMTETKKKVDLLFCEKEMDLQVEISPFYAGTGETSGRRLSSSAQGILQGVRITGQVPRLIEGRDASYFIDEENGEFCRVDRKQVEKIEPLMEAAVSGKIDARIGRRNLRDFYQRTLPQLREAVDVVEYDREIVESYLPPDPVFVFYFDIEGGVVLCRPDVHYGMQIHTILDIVDGMAWSGRIELYRDREKERQALDLILKYVPTVFEELRVLIIEQGDEEHLFNLLAYGLEELMSCGEVRMTESFRRLGLRRHMKFSVGVSVESSNLMDLRVLSEDLSEEELLNIFYQYQKKRKFVRLKNGDFLKLDQNETVEQLLEIMETMGVSLEEFVSGKMQIPVYRALYLDKMLEQMQDVYAERDTRFRKLVKEFKTVEDSDYEVPVSLRGTLRKYQAAGYRWMKTLDQYGFGGILADEMGLGKTLQVITVLLSDKEAQNAPDSGDSRNSLVLPDAVGGRDALEIMEAGEDRGDLAAADSGDSGAALVPMNTMNTKDSPDVQDGRALDSRDLPAPARARVSLVICPASLVYNWGEELRRFAPQLKTGLVTGTKKERSRIIEEYHKYDVLVTSYDLLKRDIYSYKGKSFRFEIIDEAQYIKNHTTAAAKSVKLISAQTRFALTGTPIENRLSELWSIFDYLMPGFLYSYARFQADIEQPAVKFENEETMQRLRRMVSPFILRRRKEDVLRDLPEKLEEVRYAGMEAKQRKLYDGQVIRMKADMSKRSESDFRRNRLQVLAELTRIRQICCDPSLILENYDGGSAKREVCMELIRGVIEGEHKALVFSQFTSMLELLENDLKKEGIDYYKITGATPKERRIEMVREFNENTVPVFLISLKAGGTGLNLTGADVVIHFDPWWNVAAQNQATDRTHRIGQTRVVTVYKLIAKDTIEERILEMQENKKKLAEDILSGENIASSTISREDLLDLLG